MLKENKSRNGFTLLEVLIVLFMWSFLVLLIAPFHFSHIETQQEDSFFETFAYDVLYTQSLSTTTKDYIQINLYEDRYTIRRGYKGEVLLTRNIPSDWVIKAKVFHTISFDDKGRIRMPGTFFIQTKDDEYSVVFPFGKGRYHVVKQ